MLDQIILLLLAAGAGMSLWLLFRIFLGAVAAVQLRIETVFGRLVRLISSRGRRTP